MEQISHEELVRQYDEMKRKQERGIKLSAEEIDGYITYITERNRLTRDNPITGSPGGATRVTLVVVVMNISTRSA